jgi:hypothetical protein
MWLRADLFEELPEVGDLDKPTLVFFVDEPHLLFDDASDVYLEAVAQTVRLIRSKGLGVFFVTQTPGDLPAEVVSQMGEQGPACAAPSPAGRHGAQGDGVDVPDVAVRPRGGADLARGGADLARHG